MHLKQAYRAILEGRALDAEIELERAEDNIRHAYAIRGTTAGVRELRRRVNARFWNGFRSAVKWMWGAAKRPLAVILAPVWIFLAAVVVIVMGYWVIQATNIEAMIPEGIRTASEYVPLLASGNFWLVVLILIAALFFLPALGVFYLRSRSASLQTGANERSENAWPWVQHAIFGLLSGLFSVTIAVVAVLAYQETISPDEASTWGTNLDLVVAVGLGVLAHRTVQSLRAASEGLAEYLGGPPKGQASPASGTTGSDAPTKPTG